jgi:hypothetical protein
MYVAVGHEYAHHRRFVLPECESCGRPIERLWRYCAWCAAPQRVKLVEFFASHPSFERERALRVSRYLAPEEGERHVRFSVWQEDAESAEAEAAVSLEEGEAERLARFLLNGRPAPSCDPLARQSPST